MHRFLVLEFFFGGCRNLQLESGFSVCNDFWHNLSNAGYDEIGEESNTVTKTQP